MTYYDRCPCYYCKYFINPRSQAHDLFWPVKKQFWKVWFSLPSKIMEENRKGQTKLTDPLTPFYGYVMDIPEDGVFTYKWWQYLKPINQYLNERKAMSEDTTVVEAPAEIAEVVADPTAESQQ